ncbi:RNA polymerase sigma factor [Kitasatospora sp. NPDC085895]|uniref:RNA polymerase sigma factor n=1 Tax=Kitasatospora sp. NPDC085895 TaxID=3155057 RepID=UPI00344DF283
MAHQTSPHPPDNGLTPPAPHRVPVPAASASAEADAGCRRLPDDVLAVRAAEGDQEAFSVLVRRHTPGLLKLAYHLLGNLPDAEEAVQDAFTSAWRRLAAFHHRASFHTWMHRITINCCLNVRRRHRTLLPLHEVPEPADSDPGGVPSSAAEADALAGALLAALERLPAHQRICWVLYELQGLSYRDICQITGVGEPTVRGRLFRARRTLQEVLAPWR